MLLRKAKHLNLKTVIIQKSEFSEELNYKVIHWGVLSLKKDSVFIKAQCKSLTTGAETEFNFFDDDYVQILM